MTIYLYQVRYMLNRAHRTCQAFGVTDICCIKCSAGAITELSRRGLAVREQEVLPAAQELLALESTYPTPISQVDWSRVSGILLGGEKQGLPTDRVQAEQTASIPMQRGPHGLTVEAALAIALYQWSHS